MINELTDEQKDLISSYTRKWKQIAFSTSRVNQQRTAEIVRYTYELSEQPAPEILFFDGPLHMLRELGDPPSNLPTFNLFGVASGIPTQLRRQVAPLLWTHLWRCRGYMVGVLTRRHVSYPIASALQECLGYPLNRQTVDQLSALSVIGDVAILDFLISELGCQHSFDQQWQTAISLIENCVWHFAFEGTCIICDNPTILNNSLGENLEVLFNDGLAVSTCHNRFSEDT